MGPHRIPSVFRAYLLGPLPLCSTCPSQECLALELHCRHQHFGCRWASWAEDEVANLKDCCSKRFRTIYIEFHCFHGFRRVWMDGRTDGRTEGWMDGWTDGWMQQRGRPCNTRVIPGVRWFRLDVLSRWAPRRRSPSISRRRAWRCGEDLPLAVLLVANGSDALCS